MQKAVAIELLGGSIRAASEAIGVTYKAVHKWPDVLPQRISDRVEAALSRMEIAKSSRGTGKGKSSTQKAKTLRSAN